MSLETAQQQPDGNEEDSPLDQVKTAMVAAIPEVNVQLTGDLARGREMGKPAERITLDMSYDEAFECKFLVRVLIEQHTEESTTSYGTQKRAVREVADLDKQTIRAILLKLTRAQRAILAERLEEDAQSILYPHIELSGNFGDLQSLQEGVRRLCNRILSPRRD